MFPLWGNGSGVFLRELAAKLQNHHEIAIVAPEKRMLAGVKQYKVNAPQDGVFVGHPELPGAKRFADMSGRELGEIYTTYLWTAVRAVYDFKPDVIHVFHTAFLPSIALILKSLFGTRYIITTHGSDLNYLEKDKRFLKPLKEASKQARFITANSDFTKNWYLRMCGEDLRQKTTVIYGGVNLAPYKRDPQKIEIINKKYNLSDKKVVLFTGRLTRHKGVIHLVRAAKNIKGTVLIVGDGPEKQAIQAEIKERNLTNVILAGYINSSDPLYHAYYERADVYVAPSTWEEPLGLTIIEAMAGHTPVVASRKGGIVSIITNNVNGFLVPPRNSAVIAAQVNILLENDKLRERIATVAYNTIIEKFSWDKIARRFEKLYEETAGKRIKPTTTPFNSFFNWFLAKR